MHQGFFEFLTVCFFCSVLSVHLTSSKSLVGIAAVASEIQKEKKVVYFSAKTYIWINMYVYLSVLVLISSTCSNILLLIL